jgi:glycosyltransferase involved in cell wall biosynthesis
LSQSSASADRLVTVVVLTLDEEMNLDSCLDSVMPVATRVFVVDAGSSDGTTDIAERHGALVFHHPFETHSAQWRWALDQLPIETDWVLALDADQRLTPELASELCSLRAEDLAGLDGVYIKRRQWFRDRWIRHGGYYPKYMLKMFRRGKVTIDSRDLVDHHFYIAGAVKKLRHDLIESNRKEDDLSFFVEKHRRYAKLLAREEIRWRTSPRPTAIQPALFGSPDQRSLALKRVWRRMPLFVRPCLYFFYRYVIRLGFLDGRQGAVFHFVQAFWFRLQVDIKVAELRRQGARPS